MALYKHCKAVPRVSKVTGLAASARRTQGVHVPLQHVSTMFECHTHDCSRAKALAALTGDSLKAHLVTSRRQTVAWRARSRQLQQFELSSIDAATKSTCRSAQVTSEAALDTQRRQADARACAVMKPVRANVKLLDDPATADQQQNVPNQVCYRGPY
jgi:hypothetical protein